MTEREKQIENCRKLGMTEKEIAEMLEEDSKVDLMTKSSEIENDLTAEQKKGLKAINREHSGKYEKSLATIEQEQKRRQEKTTALELLMNAVDVVEVIKPEAEFIFSVEGIKYRCNIKRVRKQ